MTCIPEATLRLTSGCFCDGELKVWTTKTCRNRIRGGATCPPLFLSTSCSGLDATHFPGNIEQGRGQNVPDAWASIEAADTEEATVLPRPPSPGPSPGTMDPTAPWPSSALSVTDAFPRRNPETLRNLYPGARRRLRVSLFERVDERRLPSHVRLERDPHSLCGWIASTPRSNTGATPATV
ncbi:hypothetical protein VUR80DRAFT_5954 [Thermomyces stellatus]